MNDPSPAAKALAFEVVTLFPEAIEGFVAAGLLGKALERGLVQVRCTNMRDFTEDKHRTVDDAPFGGGAGMVMKPEPVVRALESIDALRGPAHRILLTPSAPRFDQRAAERLVGLDRIALVCGRYEGIDDRVREHFVDECLSLGDFVLGGGEVAALAIMEAVSRLREGVLGNPASIVHESFAGGDTGQWLEHPQYTRPAVFRGHAVPEVLQGGNHAAIDAWRRDAARRRTWALRPELRTVTALEGRVDVHVAIDAGLGGHDTVLASVARRHGVRSLILLGAERDAVVEFAEATGGRAQVAAFSDLASMARRMRQRVRIVALVPEADLPPPDAAPRGCVVREPGELLDLLAERCTPVVLWLPADPASVSSSPPAGLLALFAPTGGAQIGCVALATEPAIVDPSRPPSIPRPVPPSGAHDSIDSGERAAISPPAAPSADEGQPDAGTGAWLVDRALTLLRNPNTPG